MEIQATVQLKSETYVDWSFNSFWEFDILRVRFLCDGDIQLDELIKQITLFQEDWGWNETIFFILSN